MPRMTEQELAAYNMRQHMRSLTPQQRQALDDNVADEAESELHEQFSQYLRYKSIPFIHSRMDRKATIARGIEDFACAVKGNDGKALWVAIEMKVAGRQLSAEQEVRKQEILHAGGRYVVARSLAAAIAEIQEAEKGQA